MIKAKKKKINSNITYEKGRIQLYFDVKIYLVPE